MTDGAGALAVGVILGVLFFGGLWWTLQQVAGHRWPVHAMAASGLLRMAMALAGFHWVGAGEWSRLLWCLLGFLIARVSVTWCIPLLPGAPPARSHRAD